MKGHFLCEPRIVEAETPLKNSARYLKANINLVFCEINATINMLTEWFHLGWKVLMLSSSVVCLSLTVLNTFENKGSIKIVFFL